MDSITDQIPNVKTALITEMDGRIAHLETELKTIKRWAITAVAFGALNLVVKLAHDGMEKREAQPIQHSQPIEASGNTVTIGAKETATEAPRDYKTVAEFAESAGLAPRTISSYIAEGRIQPQPVKAGREWIIPATSRILPQSAADSR